MQNDALPDTFYADSEEEEGDGEEGHGEAEAKEF